MIGLDIPYCGACAVFKCLANHVIRFVKWLGRLISCGHEESNTEKKTKEVAKRKLAINQDEENNDSFDLENKKTGEYIKLQNKHVGTEKTNITKEVLNKEADNSSGSQDESVDAKKTNILTDIENTKKTINKNENNNTSSMKEDVAKITPAFNQDKENNDLSNLKNREALNGNKPDEPIELQNKPISEEETNILKNIENTKKTSNGNNNNNTSSTENESVEVGKTEILGEIKKKLSSGCSDLNCIDRFVNHLQQSSTRALSGFLHALSNEMVGAQLPIHALEDVMNYNAGLFNVDTVYVEVGVEKKKIYRTIVDFYGLKSFEVMENEWNSLITYEGQNNRKDKRFLVRESDRSPGKPGWIFLYKDKNGKLQINNCQTTPPLERANKSLDHPQQN